MERFGLAPKGKATLEIVDKWIDKRVIYANTKWVRRFCCLIFRNKGELVAKRCYATLELTKKPGNADRFHSLHWADMPYTYEAFAEPIDMEPGALARLDIIFKTVQGEESDSPVTSGEIQTKIVKGEPAAEGAWIATPISLSWPMVNNQNYLPPGEYQAKLEIKSGGEDLFARDLRIKSPKSGEKLEIEI